MSVGSGKVGSAHTRSTPVISLSKEEIPGPAQQFRCRSVVVLVRQVNLTRFPRYHLFVIESMELGVQHDLNSPVFFFFFFLSRIVSGVGPARISMGKKKAMPCRTTITSRKLTIGDDSDFRPTKETGNLMKKN
jgi:hypothetical protein